MENISVLNNPYFNNDNIYETYYNREKISNGNPGFSPVKFSLTAEGGKNFFRYLKRFNLFTEPDLLILPPNSHYYYDENDLKSVRTLINLKKLNLIKDLDTFLYTLSGILPPNVNFMGCFSDSKTLKGNRFLSGLSNRFNNLLDSRPDHNMDKKNVSELLEKYGFKVVDMTEMNGITYFYSLNVCQPVEFRA
jgi:hypothetical protein